MARIKMKGKENWVQALKQAKQMGIVLTKRKNYELLTNNLFPE